MFVVHGSLLISAMVVVIIHAAQVKERWMNAHINLFNRLVSASSAVHLAPSKTLAEWTANGERQRLCHRQMKLCVPYIARFKLTQLVSLLKSPDQKKEIRRVWKSCQQATRSALDYY